ncbi:hypothetical protein SAMN05421854_103142 [Amycolatopsis rubida]|uniref:Uncharacterized protein n=1 Tax=Amycolatopsis rubida TaxID=112413 RepID=A0A1I5KDR0_9PSEU|nr:hypothetical protein SAMN05421854_103142 [Amycolatopsis rubida]
MHALREYSDLVLGPVRPILDRRVEADRTRYADHLLGGAEALLANLRYPRDRTGRPGPVLGDGRGRGRCANRRRKLRLRRFPSRGRCGFTHLVNAEQHTADPLLMRHGGAPRPPASRAARPAADQCVLHDHDVRTGLDLPVFRGGHRGRGPRRRQP